MNTNVSALTGNGQDETISSNVAAQTGQSGVSSSPNASHQVPPTPGGVFSGLLTPEQGQQFDTVLKWGGLIGLIWLGLKILGPRY